MLLQPLTLFIGNKYFQGDLLVLVQRFVLLIVNVHILYSFN